MSCFSVLTDSACDIAKETLKEWHVDCIEMSYEFQNIQVEKELGIREFYDCMRQGGIAKTSAINPDAFNKQFKTYLEQGQDVLYLSFSSGLSTTYNSARLAAEELLEAYPDRKIRIVDSLCASAGQGLFVYLVSQKANACETLEELADFAENLKRNLCHWFTVDDLVYLKRGGRVSPTAAFFGGVLGIKPVLHVDDDGHLINVAKVRGRKASIAALADKYSELAQDPENGVVFLSHGDCFDDADALANMLKERHGVTVRLIADIGPVIGAHSGPGTLALFFVGKNR